MGLVYRHLHLLDRYEPLGYPAVSYSAFDACRLAKTNLSLCRGNDNFFIDDSRPVCLGASGPLVAGLLCYALPKRALGVAKLSVAIGVGYVRNRHLSQLLRNFSVCRHDSRSGNLP